VRSAVTFAGACLLTGSTLAGEARASEPWALATCPPDSDAKAVEFERSVRSAAPGSAVFARVPYPEALADVVRDFEDQYTVHFRRTAFVPAADRALLALLEAGAARYVLLDVANWMPQRCNLVRGTRTRSFLLRIFDSRSGTEGARIVLHPSGLLGTVTTPRANVDEATAGLRLADGHDIEALDAAARIAGELGLVPESMQYVALSGPAVYCPTEVPCIAFRQGERAFLYRSGEVYELAHTTTRLSNAAFVHEGPQRDAIVESLAPGQQVVSLGGDELTLAKLVPKP
jgi:hypothetical protein